MSVKLKKSVISKELALSLKLEHRGTPIPLQFVTSSNLICPEALCFYTKGGNLEGPTSSAVIGLGNLETKSTLLVSQNPRLDFVKALGWLNECVGFQKNADKPKIHPSVVIGQNSFVGPGCEIGEGTRIEHHVVITGEAKIGKNCVIKSGAVIGEEGFGFERDGDETPLRMLHLGSVQIGNNVEVGSLTTICRGTLSDTVIEDDAKIDDHVHVAHNCWIGRKSIITACAELSGGTIIGEASWIAPNASVLEKVKLAPRSFIGLGAVVLRNTEENSTYVGNPARKLEKKL